MKNWLSELRQATSRLRRNPSFTVPALLLLAVGVAATTALFAVLDAAVLRPVAYPEPQRLVSVLANRPSRGLERVSLSPADFLRLRAASRSFAVFGAYVPFGTVDWTGGGDASRLDRFLVSEGLLEALRPELSAGRSLQAGDYAAGAPPVALVSHRLAQGRLGGPAAAVGTELALDGLPHTVVGVLPADLRLPGGDPDLVLPLVLPAGAAEDFSSAYLGGVGRLRDDATLADATAELAVLAASAPARDGEPADLTFDVRTLGELYTLKARLPLTVLFTAVLLLLALAAANLASLQLVRGLARQGELAIRSALGASGRHLAAPVIAEQAVLATAGTLVAVPLAMAILRLMPDPRGVFLPASLALRLDARALAFCAMATAVVVVASGLAAGARATGRPIAGTLRAASTGRPERVLAGLVVAEVALAFVLLFGGGILGDALRRLSAEPSGLAPGRVLTVELSLPASRYPTPEAVEVAYGRLMDDVASLPGVAAAGLAREVPPSSSWSYEPEVVGEQLPAGAGADWLLVSPGYFEAMGTPLVEGRGFEAGDRRDRQPVAVVNEAFVRELLGGRPALERQLGFNGDTWEIVGVAADQQAPGVEVEPTVYLAYSQSTVPPDMVRARTLVLSTGGDPAALGSAVGGAVRRLDPELPWRSKPLSERLAAAGPVARSRLQAAVLGTFAAVSLLLAVVGVHGVLAFVARRRSREIGIRMALGATARSVVRLVVGRGALLTTLGVFAGALAAPAVADLLGRLPDAPATADWRLVALTGGALLAAGLLAALVPAWRASRQDPVAVLREG
jgi:putative ABC transport system permease protein